LSGSSAVIQDNPATGSVASADTTSTTTIGSSKVSTIVSSDSPSVSEAEVNIGANGKSPAKPPVRVAFISEQVRHHPPISAFYAECPEKGLVISGNDQLSARFTGICIPDRLFI
jgi:oxysterol-binding protein-related protein 9/10/11